jgi:hypothetical protein
MQDGFEWVGLIDAFGKVENVTVVTEEVPLAASPSVTSVLPTETAVPTSTPLPTQTPIPTLTPTSTPIPIPCNAAEFITDVTIPDGSAFTPNTAFEKIWRLKNVGTRTWTDGYNLVFTNGNEMDGPSAIALPGIVESGQSIDISVRLKAPANAGDYQSFWMLRDSGNVLFGIGDDADKPFGSVSQLLEKRETTIMILQSIIVPLAGPQKAARSLVIIKLNLMTMVLLSSCQLQRWRIVMKMNRLYGHIQTKSVMGGLRGVIWHLPFNQGMFLRPG